MPGTKYTDKQERKADHIEQSYREKGVSKDEAEARAWATVNKQDGGGEKPGGSGRKAAADTKKTAPKTKASPSAKSALTKAPTSDKKNRPGKSSSKSTSAKKKN